LEELAADAHGDWDTYIANAPGATFFHRAGWMRAIRDVYGHRPCYFVAREPGSGRICGVLPLFAVSGPLTGRALISIPYAVSGGVVADHAGIEAQMVATAQREARRQKVRYLELRSASLGDQLTVRDHYFGFRTVMPSAPDQVLGRFPRKARAEIRKARDQFKLTARFGHDLLGPFYRLYVRSLRRLGSPGHSWKFFSRLVDEFGEDCLVEVVSHQDTPVAGVMAFRFRDQVLPYYAGIDSRFSRMNPSNYLYFALMGHAVRLGLRIFDFGRTRRDNAGGCQFKINQGFEPEPLPYSFYSPQGHEPPDLRPSNSAFSRCQEIWRRLPLRVVGPLGGIVSRWLP
jgi:FemAB-related protein (PEP-CTERM system-associated)